MPFTFAHPSIVIPIKEKGNKWVDATALVLGSMAPDFEYFVRFKPQAVVGHTVSGFLFFNLPMVFIVALLWHYIVKKPFVLSLPKFSRRFFAIFLSEEWEIRSLKAFVVFVLSALIGMGSHVFWDGFTHRGAYFVNKITFLSEYIFIFNMRIPVYKCLQHGSTFIGFWIIFVYLQKMAGKMNKVLPKTHVKRQIVYWIFVFLVAAGIVIFRMFYTMKTFDFTYYGEYIVTGISGTIIGVVCASLIFHSFKIYLRT